MIFRRFMIIILLVVAVLIIGITGYMAIEGLSFIDALYMSVITVSTVGFDEVKELSFQGRLFTIAMIICGISIVTFAFAMFSTLIMQGEMGYYIRRKKMDKKLKAMNNHIIVCGLGELGEEVVRNLIKHKKKFVVIDNSIEEINRVENIYGEFVHIVGDATELVVLESSGVRTAKTLITCLGSDSDNLLVVFTAKDLNSSLTVVAEAIDRNIKDKLKRAGSDHIISPSQIGGTRMASVAVKPAVVSFLDIVTSSGEKELQIESVAIKTKSKVANMSLFEAKIPQRTGLIVISIRKSKTGDLIYNPSSKTILEPEDEIIVLGQQENISALKHYTG